MVLFFYGADEFRSRRHRAKTIEAFKQKRDPQGFNTFVFDARDAQPREIMETLRTAPFLAEKKMVVLDHVFASKNETLAAELEKWINSYGKQEETIVLVWAGGGEYEGTLFELLRTQPFVQEFVVMSPSEYAGYIAQEAQTVNMTVGGEVASELARLFHGDTPLCMNVLAQLIAYTRAKGGAEIMFEDIARFVPGTFDDNTFHFVDALGAHDLSRAVALLQDQWKAGKDTLEITGALLWKWRTLMLARAFLDSETNAKAADFARATKLHNFVAEKSVRAVKNVPTELLLAQYNELKKIDYAQKRGGNGRMLLELFTVRASS